MTARSHRRRDRGNKRALYRLKSEAFKKEKNKEKRIPDLYSKFQHF